MSDDNEYLAKREHEQHEADKKSKILIQAELLQVDVPMPSGNIYPRAAVEAAMAEFKTQVAAGNVLGMFNPADTQTGVRLEDVSHQVTSVYMRDDVLMADLEVLPTPRGKSLLEWLKTPGSSIKVSPRSFGEVGEDNKVSDFHIVTVDIWGTREED